MVRQCTCVVLLLMTNVTAGVRHVLCARKLAPFGGTMCKMVCGMARHAWSQQSLLTVLQQWLT